MVYRTISIHNGDIVNDLHEYFKRKLLPPQFIKVLGREVKLPASTSKLSKIELSEYVERIRAEVALFGISIPDPDDKDGDAPMPTSDEDSAEMTRNAKF